MKVMSPPGCAVRSRQSHANKFLHIPAIWIIGSQERICWTNKRFLGNNGSEGRRTRIWRTAMIHCSAPADCFLKFYIVPVTFCASACSLTCSRARDFLGFYSWMMFSSDARDVSATCVCSLLITHPRGFFRNRITHVCLSDSIKPKNARQTACEGLERHLLVQSGNAQFLIGWKSSNLLINQGSKSVWFKRHAAHYLRIIHVPEGAFTFSMN